MKTETLNLKIKIVLNEFEELLTSMGKLKLKADKLQEIQVKDNAVFCGKKVINLVPLHFNRITIKELKELYKDSEITPIMIIKSLRFQGILAMESEVIKIKDKSVRAYKVLDRSKMT